MKSRTDVLVEAITKYVPGDIAHSVPTVSISNNNPNASNRLGELYTTVFEVMDDNGLTPFFMATAHNLVRAEDKITRQEREIGHLRYQLSDTEARLDNFIHLTDNQQARIKRTAIEKIFYGIEVAATFVADVGRELGRHLVDAGKSFLRWLRN